MIEQDQTFVIAEAGVNHNGKFELAKKMIDKASEASADAVKFQIFQAEELVTEDASKAEYQEEAGVEDSQYEMLKRLELEPEDYRELIKYTREQNLDFLCTPFDKESADLLEELGVKAYKIGSGDITDIPLLEHIAKKNKPMIVSTGMANISEVEEAVNAIREKGNDQLYLLHCISNYPAQASSYDLETINTLEQAFDLRAGLSDHTMGYELPIAAVAKSASIIEKHFTLDRDMEGPDHDASLEPKELEEMITKIRSVERAIGNGVVKPAEEEMSTREIARKSIVTRKHIEEGQKIEEEDLAMKRPEKGIKPKYLHRVVGRKANRNLEPNEILDYSDLIF